MASTKNAFENYISNASLLNSTATSSATKLSEDENLFDEEVQRFDADSYRKKYGDRWKKFASTVRDVVQPDGTIIREYVIEDPTLLEQLSEDDDNLNYLINNGAGSNMNNNSSKNDPNGKGTYATVMTSDSENQPHTPNGNNNNNNNNNNIMNVSHNSNNSGELKASAVSVAAYNAQYPGASFEITQSCKITAQDLQKLQKATNNNGNNTLNSFNDLLHFQPINALNNPAANGNLNVSLNGASNLKPMNSNKLIKDEEEADKEVEIIHEQGILKFQWHFLCKLLLRELFHNYFYNILIIRVRY